MPLPFRKLHGLGNDYLFVDVHTDPALEHARDWPALSRAMSPRHTGVGADGIILVARPSDPRASGVSTAPPHVRMRIFNADGSEAQMCGNGVRCVCKFAWERLGIHTHPMRVETGTHAPRRMVEVVPRVVGGRVHGATVNMGAALVGPSGANLDEALAPRVREHVHRVDVSGAGHVAFVPVGMGNPHAVIVPSIGSPAATPADLHALGPALERHPAFREGVNVHAFAVRSPVELVMVTWERGSGFTQACGSGACATVAAAHALGLTGPRVTARVPGGALEIDVQPGGVLMTGPAEEVFAGEWTG